MRKRIRPSNALRVRRDLSLMRRLLAKVQQDDKGCWLWTGHADESGYGQIKIAGRAQWAHRISYALFKQRIPAGVEIDHKCHNPSCINPDHLRRADVSANRSRNGWHKRHIPCDDFPV